jgi:hypothetical protein
LSNGKELKTYTGSAGWRVEEILRFCDDDDWFKASFWEILLPASGGSCYALVWSIRKPEVRIDACAQRRQIARFNAENDVRAGKRDFCPASFVILGQAF